MKSKNKFSPVHVKVFGTDVQADRIFTKPGKLNSYLRMLNKHYTNLQILSTTIKLN